MDDKFLYVESVIFCHIAEYITLLAVDYYFLTTIHMGYVPGETVKGITIIITKRLNKDQQLQGIPGGNYSGKHHRR